MNQLDPKVKGILIKLDALIRERVSATARGLPVVMLDVEINTLKCALRVIEGNANG